MSSTNNTVPDNPCYLCQRRMPHCHSQCKDYISYTQYRQTLSQAKLSSSLNDYEHERFEKIQRRIHNVRK